jgi:hypothetical protein
MDRILQPKCEPDNKLRSTVQWRRAPFGINRLEKDCEFLGLNIGQSVPQIVIHENIRERKAKGSTEWLLDPYLSARAPIKTRPRRDAEHKFASDHVPDGVLEIIRDLCEAEWGAVFPKPMKVGVEGGEAIIHFANHVGDQKPSTFVKGYFRKLLILGKNDFHQDFYLPGENTAAQLVSLAMEMAESISPSDGAEHLTPEDRSAIIARERQSIKRIAELHVMRSKRDHLITSVEGGGKTTSFLNEMSNALQDKTVGASQHFSCYAARSRQQATEKRREHDETSRPWDIDTVLLESFWTLYAETCGQAEVKPLGPREFESGTVSDVLAVIAKRQPRVFDLLENYRRNFWNDAKFCCATTMIFTTKATIRTWHKSFFTRAWLHPNFAPGISPEQERKLARDFGLGCVAFDELELDEFLHIWPEPYYELITRHHEAHPEWTRMSRREKLSVYEKFSGNRPSYDQFEADMRVRLSSLERVLVNFDAAPFGWDKNDKGIYRQLNGTVYYLGVQSWLFAGTSERYFLTTERLMTEVVRASFRKKPTVEGGRRKARLDFKQVDPPSELFPIRVAVCIDKRASARRIDELAREITDANPDAYVICNGVKDNDDVLTFQKAKGANHLADNDIYIIVTSLNPDHYARLNVVGQWLGIPDVIELFYRDQINQAVGRNKGFRDTGNERKTVVVTSARLAKSGIFAPSPPTESSPGESQAGLSELRKEMRRSFLFMMSDNEFSPRRTRFDHVLFELTGKRMW